MADAMDPMEAGRLALRGIRANQMFILTHPEYQGVKQRSDVLLASNPRDKVPPGRLKLEANFLSSEVYVPVPLEATYQAAWEAVPAYWRGVLTAPADS